MPGILCNMRRSGRRLIRNVSLFILFFYTVIYCVQYLNTEDTSSRKIGSRSVRQVNEFAEMLPIQIPNPNATRWFRKGVIYNRVPKCGSSTFSTLLLKMQRRRKFHFIISKDYDHERISPSEQVNLTQSLLTESGLFLYNRHLHFVDFSSMRIPMPYYINLIRHPIDRFISHYSYQKQLFEQNLLKSNKHIESSLSDCVLQNGENCFKEAQFTILKYFCGQAEICRTNTAGALKLAMKNIDQYYTVIGTIEDFDQFLKLLECALPNYFSGAHAVYNKDPKRSNQSKHKEILTKESEAILNRTMSLELQLYAFVQKKQQALLQHYSGCMQMVR